MTYVFVSVKISYVLNTVFAALCADYVEVNLSQY